MNELLKEEKTYQDLVEENTSFFKKPFLVLGLTIFLVWG